MHHIEILYLDPDGFRRRFRHESAGWVYDPSLGRKPGRPVSSAEMQQVNSDFRKLHSQQQAQISLAAKLFIVAIVVTPVVAIWIGSRLLAMWGMMGLIGLLIAKLVEANFRVHQFTRSYWRRIERRPETTALSVDEQIRRGYRNSWGVRLGSAFMIALIAPGYGYAHSGGHDYLALIPGIGPAVSYWYWLGAKLLGLVGLLAILGLIVRKAVIAMMKNRTSSNGPVASRQQSLDLLAHKAGRADLSGVENTKVR